MYYLTKHFLVNLKEQPPEKTSVITCHFIPARFQTVLQPVITLRLSCINSNPHTNLWSVFWSWSQSHLECNTLLWSQVRTAFVLRFFSFFYSHISKIQEVWRFLKMLFTNPPIFDVPLMNLRCPHTLTILSLIDTNEDLRTVVK